MCLLVICLLRSLLHLELFPHSVQAKTPFSISVTIKSSSSELTEVPKYPEMKVKYYTPRPLKCFILVRAECVRQRNEVAIKLGIFFSLSLSLSPAVCSKP